MALRVGPGIPEAVYVKVTGQFLEDPDMRPLRGSVTFTPGPPTDFTRVLIGADIVRVMPTPVMVYLNRRGYLDTKGPLAPDVAPKKGTGRGDRAGVTLLALSTAPVWYRVDFALTTWDGEPCSFPSFEVLIADPGPIDLGAAIPRPVTTFQAVELGMAISVRVDLDGSFWEIEGDGYYVPGRGMDELRRLRDAIAAALDERGEGGAA